MYKKKTHSRNTVGNKQDEDELNQRPQKEIDSLPHSVAIKMDFKQPFAELPCEECGKVERFFMLNFRSKICIACRGTEMTEHSALVARLRTQPEALLSEMREAARHGAPGISPIMRDIELVDDAVFERIFVHLGTHLDSGEWLAVMFGLREDVARHPVMMSVPQGQRLVEMVRDRVYEPHVGVRESSKMKVVVEGTRRFFISDADDVTSFAHAFLHSVIDAGALSADFMDDRVRYYTNWSNRAGLFASWDKFRCSYSCRECIFAECPICLGNLSTRADMWMCVRCRRYAHRTCKTEWLREQLTSGRPMSCESCRSDYVGAYDIDTARGQQLVGGRVVVWRDDLKI